METSMLTASQRDIASTEIARLICGLLDMREPPSQDELKERAKMAAEAILAGFAVINRVA